MSTLEEMYQFYLNKVNLDEKTMGKIQRIEIRRAFFGAIGIFLINYTQEASAGDEVEIPVQKFKDEIAEVFSSPF